MHIPFPGEIAGIASSVFLAIGPTFFTLAGRLAGAQTVNRMRLLMAAVLIMLTHLFLTGRPLPLDASGGEWFWLGLSGLIGFVAGDACLFQAFVMIGTRLSMLVFSISPIIAVLFARLWLGETLAPVKLLAVAIILAGVLWVVGERKNNGDGRDRRHYAKGLLFALGGATGQALGMIAAKQGLQGDISTLSGLTIRLIAGAVGIWLWALLRRQVVPTFVRFRSQRRALLFTAGGTLAGPAIGIWLSLVALKYTQVGVACTLMALPPIFLLPIGRRVFGERISARALLGTSIALGGVALLFMGAA